ncbi:MAG: hypothetical protein BroJett040_19770 [Oligoflexia bacterium]|nr:MAG: hypothetical protein BroJett040_19770 [Oligoflexia bacterium]
MTHSRQYLRFKDNPLLSAKIDFVEGDDFKPTHAALIMNESFTGVGLVLYRETEPKSGDQVKVKIGDMGHIQGTIVWVKELDKNLYKLGVEFKE